MLELSAEAKTVFRYLVGILPTVRAGHPETYRTYGQVHADLGLPGTARDLEHLGLGELANALHVADLPGITGLVVRQDTSMPGQGYFLLYERDLMDFAWWEAEIAKSKGFDWSAYIGNPAPPPTPKATDLKKPERVETTVYRILRDTLVALRVKQLHRYRCQICGETIKLPDGSLYAEAHHIHPLGREGPDVAANILCLCPNHHVELDYMVRRIDKSELRSADGHDVGDEFIRYHNDRLA